jgi:hypothetical protein
MSSLTSPKVLTFLAFLVHKLGIPKYAFFSPALFFFLSRHYFIQGILTLHLLPIIYCTVSYEEQEIKYIFSALIKLTQYQILPILFDASLAYFKKSDYQG